ncbi:hypothetical protein [Vibrio phage vB_VpaP_SJSY21]|nr:hypothetical protein [Vibrio phage vB_VpaP_SJSY21]
MSEKSLCGKHFRTPGDSVIRVLSIGQDSMYECRSIVGSGLKVARLFRDGWVKRKTSELLDKSRYEEVVLDDMFESNVKLLEYLNKYDLEEVLKRTSIDDNLWDFNKQLLVETGNLGLSTPLELKSYVLGMSNAKLTDLRFAISEAFRKSNLEGEVGELWEWIAGVATDRRCKILSDSPLPSSHVQQDVVCDSEQSAEKAEKLPKLSSFKGLLAKHTSEDLPVNYIFMVEESKWGVSPKVGIITGAGITVTLSAYDFVREYEVINYDYEVGDVLVNRKSGDKFKVSSFDGDMIQLKRYDGFETSIVKYDVHKLLKLVPEPTIEVGEYFYVTDELNPDTFVVWKVKEVRATGRVLLKAVRGHKVPGTLITRSKERLLDTTHFTRPFTSSLDAVMELRHGKRQYPGVGCTITMLGGNSWEVVSFDGMSYLLRAGDTQSTFTTDEVMNSLVSIEYSNKGVDTSGKACSCCGEVPKDLIICDGICTPCFDKQFYDCEDTIVNEKEESENMTRIVKVSIVDNSAGLKNDADRLVASFKNIVTTKTDEQVKMEILMGQDVASKLKAHNEKREKLVDEDILNRTGNEVNLRPVELHDLTWLIQE